MYEVCAQEKFHMFIELAFMTLDLCNQFGYLYHEQSL